MKQSLSLLLAALMLLACLSAFAEPARYEAQGFALDFGAVTAKSANYPVLMDYGVTAHDPFIAMMLVGYFALPKDVVADIENRMESAEDEATYQALEDTLSTFSAKIAYILVTDADTPTEAGLDDPLPEGCALTEFGTAGDYHYYYLTQPVDALSAAFDADVDLSAYGITPQALKEEAFADIQAVHSALLEQLRSAELFEPTDPNTSLIGQKIDFESVDLDGNPVRSADLFGENRITMVNCWGTWCINCLNEMGELAGIHERLREKGCGIVGLEWEQAPIAEVADLARQTLADSGITYPNVVMPVGDPILDAVTSYPTTFFVDSEGRILTWPISGAYVDRYESTVDRLLAGEEADMTGAPDTGEADATGATANEAGAYRVTVCDTDGEPVKGAIVQLCDDSTCSIQKTGADGVATFQTETQKVYEVHVAKAPEGYVPGDKVYHTLDTYCDLSIVIGKAE